MGLGKYQNRVEELIASGKTKADSYRIAADEMPHEHREWVASGCNAAQNDSKGDAQLFAGVVGRLQNTGLSKAESIRKAIDMLPGDHKAWLAEGAILPE